MRPYCQPIRFPQVRCYGASWFASAAACQVARPLCGSDRELPRHRDFYFQASVESVTLLGAGYNYDSHWMALSMGLSPIRLTSSLAARPRNLMKVVSVTAFSTGNASCDPARHTNRKALELVEGLFVFEISGAQLFFRCSKKLGSAIPIHHIPPGLNVIAAHVLILQIVRVLPNVETQDGFRVTAEQIGCVLIGSGVDGQFPVLQNEPRPAGTEAAQALGPELFLKTGK